MLTPNFDNIPSELTASHQWANWRSVSRKDGDKAIMQIYQPDGSMAKTDDSWTWSPFGTVKAAADQFDGIGFVLTQETGIVGLGFEQCRCPAFDGVAPWANSLDTVLPEIADHLRRLNTYTEISPSGKGIRSFLKSTMPVDSKCNGSIKAYQSGQYITVTGHILDGFPRTIEHRQEELDTFLQTAHGTPVTLPEQETKIRTDAAAVTWEERREIAFNSKDGKEIEKLYYGDDLAYSSQSEADLALCSHLAFWLDGDPALIDSAFRDAWRDKDNWGQKQDDGRTYGQVTVEEAIASCKSFYSDGQTKKFSYEELLNRINTTDDISVLVNKVARDVRVSGLSKTEVHNLIKAIAKKTGGTIKTLYSDTRDAAGNNDDLGKIDHLQAAKEIVTDFCRENLVYVSSLRIFRRWSGQIWAELDDRTINGAAVEHLDGKTEDVTKNVIESITDLIRTRVFRQDVIWDANTGVIPVQNGELAWIDGQWTLKPHVREHYRTTLIPVEYDPQARASRFEQFLVEVFQDDPDAVEKSILICEMIGYTLTTSCEYEKFIIMIGHGANGKSVLLDVIRLLVGPGQVAAVQPDQMNNKFQRGHLRGKLANIVTEIKEGGEIDDAALKAITSGELTTAEDKFKKPFEFQPFSTCWFGTNHMPHTRDFSDALFRRALIVEFNRVFQEQEQDKHLKGKLAAELPGILRLALTAFAGVIQRGQFTIPESCIRAKEQWRVEADQVAQFMQDCCVMEPGARVKSSVLFKTYKAWAEGAGIRQTLNRINFSKRTQRLGGRPGRTGDSRFYVGIRLVGIPQGETE